MALPMGLCGSSNGTETSVVSEEMIRRGLESLEDPMQKVRILIINKTLDSDIFQLYFMFLNIQYCTSYL